ncbi:MAG: hypothetical protein F9K40_09350 [Kofleriaceae bacterium]|nr:MAG: hypothetical protein F9K40_09350 [Kofleriaceae bacterium]MBZ0233651.1 hypothetical protein [Kofleriaceae bacterium]
MGVGLYLRGRSATKDWIPQLRGVLGHVTHPAAERIEVTDEGVVSATTTPAGPGYHVAVCDAIDAASRALAITWDRPAAADEDGGGDETGYFFERDLAAVERHMLQWLRTIAQWVLENDADGIHLALPIEHQYQMKGVLTPTGPRDAAWFRAVVDDPRTGIDFFPWWSPGDNAAALLGRARCLMWTEMRWRMPETHEEDELESDIIELLEQAWALDPTLDYPVREWAGLPGDIPDEVHARAAKATGPLLGYRRYPVRVRLAGGWSVEIPGEFSESWEDGTWSAWHDGRTVWFDGFERAAPAAELVEAAPADGDVLRRQDGDVLKKGYLTLGDDGYTLSTRNAIDGKLCLSTIVYPDEEDRDWAMHAWASLRNG